MGITDDGENAKNTRLNVIHMRGTEDMSSKDVFKYFQDYAPKSIEWINDVSCMLQSLISRNIYDISFVTDICLVYNSLCCR